MGEVETAFAALSLGVPIDKIITSGCVYCNYEIPVIWMAPSKYQRAIMNWDEYNAHVRKCKDERRATAIPSSVLSDPLVGDNPILCRVPLSPTKTNHSMDGGGGQ